MSFPQSIVVLECPSSLVKRVKTVLETRGWFGKRIERVVSGDSGVERGALPSSSEQLDGAGTLKGGEAESLDGWMRIYTKIPASEVGVTEDAEDVEDDLRDRLAQLLEILLPGSGDHAALISSLRLRTIFSTTTTAATSSNPLDNVIANFLSSLESGPTPELKQRLIQEAPKRYSLYPPLLLLSTPFSPTWQTFLNDIPTSRQSFYSSLCTATGTTHLAINAPIPASDHVRKPSSLTPLFGDFGTTSYEDKKFNDALWVKATQNGIHQTWAPVFTMFSRGNVTEKARVLRFEDVKGRDVADLYAGIGYFTFSYVKAGARRVFCWELNPWSVEALCRGARLNRWDVVRIGEGEEINAIPEEARIVVFEESNEFAYKRFQEMRRKGLVGEEGCRHVNLGLLPTSRGAWQTATQIADLRRSSLHVHENFGVEEVKERTEAVLDAIQKFVNEKQGGEIGSMTVECRHVEKVKTFAPGVLHVVLDIEITSGDKEL